jgi:hypothetical protein
MPQQAGYYTPDDLLAELRDDLKPWVQKRKGMLSIATDPYNFLELLAQSPAGWRVVLHWDGEDNTAEAAQAGDFCTQRISLGITANLGLTANPSEGMVTDTAVRKAFLGLVADLRDRVRGYVFPDQVTNRYMHYKRAVPVVLPEGVPLAGMKLDFELIAALPPAVYRNDI